MATENACCQVNLSGKPWFTASHGKPCHKRSFALLPSVAMSIYQQVLAATQALVGCEPGTCHDWMTGTYWDQLSPPCPIHVPPQPLLWRLHRGGRRAHRPAEDWPRSRLAWWAEDLPDARAKDQPLTNKPANIKLIHQLISRKKRRKNIWSWDCHYRFLQQNPSLGCRTCLKWQWDSKDFKGAMSLG